MTSLSFEKALIPAPRRLCESELPSIISEINVQNDVEVEIDEEEIFSDYGKCKNIYPYKQLDLYDRDLTEREFDIAVLENDCLKAVFIPELGGKLWGCVLYAVGGVRRALEKVYRRARK